MSKNDESCHICIRSLKMALVSYEKYGTRSINVLKLKHLSEGDMGTGGVGIKNLKVLFPNQGSLVQWRFAIVELFAIEIPSLVVWRPMKWSIIW